MVEVVRWLASLSNGETLVEGKGLLEEIKGEPSPWAKLIAYINANNLHITGLRVQVKKDSEPTKTYNLPSFNITKSGTHEKWNTVNPITPNSYDHYRWVTKAITDSSPTQRHIEIRAIYDDFFVSLFVDELEGNECWTVVHKKA